MTYQLIFKSDKPYLRECATMGKPKPYNHDRFCEDAEYANQYQYEVDVYNQHLRSLPCYPLLNMPESWKGFKDIREDMVRKEYQIMWTPQSYEWKSATKEQYDLCSNLGNRRIVFVPIEQTARNAESGLMYALLDILVACTDNETSMETIKAIEAIADEALINYFILTPIDPPDQVEIEKTAMNIAEIVPTIDSARGYFHAVEYSGYWNIQAGAFYGDKNILNSEEVGAKEAELFAKRIVRLLNRDEEKRRNPVEPPRGPNQEFA